MGQHTGHKWEFRVNPNNGAHEVSCMNLSGYRQEICEVIFDRRISDEQACKEQRANGLLIAKAPEMRDILMDLAAFYVMKEEGKSCDEAQHTATLQQAKAFVDELNKDVYT